MTYEFKNLATVELLGKMPDGANVLVEVDGVTRRAPLPAPIDEIAESEILDEVPEEAMAIVEVGGEIKRVSGASLGGATGVKTAIIKSSDYDDCLGYIQGAPSPKATAPAIEYECINMTFEEAYDTLKYGEPLNAILMYVMDNAPACVACLVMFGGTLMMGAPALFIRTVESYDVGLLWGAQGIQEVSNQES